MKHYNSLTKLVLVSPLFVLAGYAWLVLSPYLPSVS
jgi:hypothetical protein